MTSLYVHVPWCRSKCRYCAFHSVVPDASRSPSPVPRLAFAEDCAAELRARAPTGFSPEAVYVGGGTPSLLGAEGVSALCRALRGAADLSRVREWTFEANPDSLDDAVCRAMLSGGATRLSLGAQSLDPDALRWLGRAHDAEAVRRAVRTARRAGFTSVGLDLIAGIPGLSPDAWLATLHEAAAIGCDHLSVYALTVEDGTPLARDVAEGRVALPGDDAVLDALSTAEDALSAAGFVRYEISNYARPGRECLYNLSVWRGEDYLGIGPSASSRWGLLRRTNGPLLAPPAGPARGPLPLVPHHKAEAEEEILAPEDDRRERFLTGLRIREGADPRRHLLPAEAAIAEATLARLTGLGLVEPCGPARWRLTRRGREVADAVARELYMRWIQPGAHR